MIVSCASIDKLRAVSEPMRIRPRASVAKPNVALGGGGLVVYFGFDFGFIFLLCRARSLIARGSSDAS